MLQEAESVADVVVWGTLFPVLRDEAVPVGKSWVRPLLLCAPRHPGGLLGWELRRCGIAGPAFSLLQDFTGEGVNRVSVDCHRAALCHPFP